MFFARFMRPKTATPNKVILEDTVSQQLYLMLSSKLPISEGVLGIIHRCPLIALDKTTQQKKERQVKLLIMPKALVDDISCSEALVQSYKGIFVTLEKHPHPCANQVMTKMTKDYYYHILEEDNGSNLASLIQKTGPLDESSARRLFQQLISALRFYQEHRVYHGQLNPDNLWISDNNQLKISGFGFMQANKYFENDRIEYSTSRFVAPEVSVNNKYSPFAADIYSCGLILLFMLTGQFTLSVTCSLTECSSRLIKKLLQEATKRPTIEEIVLDPWFVIDNTPAPNQLHSPSVNQPR